MVYIGVDPGLKGGLAAISGDGLSVAVMPTLRVGKRNKINERALADWFLQYLGGDARVTIEAVHALPREGVSASFTFGTGFGMLLGICAALSMPYQLVRPHAWQREVLRGYAKGSEALVASRLWPDACWLATERSRKPHDGLVDAALIAEYGRRTWKEG